MAAHPRPAVERIRPPEAPYKVVNRVMRWLLSSPRRAARVGRHLLLLHVTGRKSGRALQVPVAYRSAGDGRLLVLTNSRWRVNLRDRPQVEITLRGTRRAAVAELVEDPERVARVYRDLIRQAGYAKAGRRMGIRINVDRVPTHEELVEAAAREKLALVYLDVPVRATP
ncbi:nitroreductase family deazaflavin-dependent oxidoreductase [Micromonospora sp. C31]|uniref:nitroreductase family deazaflavin-dependent oxidoreductase n=1 Tax=Micromonospora sp. C31 TaxID=2824876 RepID=UPI001B39B2A4|nr:nitroreductase family deazaflavin-dependent oxidoreductase [Micromonospora sp. C31]MBQ1074633.1 nitroreductase family deazaflavin-dependent oxidoreductase [Micromonospora sp. C31]